MALSCIAFLTSLQTLKLPILLRHGYDGRFWQYPARRDKVHVARVDCARAGFLAAAEW